MGRIEQSIINLNKEQKISGKGGNFGKKISGKEGPILYIPVYLTPFL